MSNNSQETARFGERSEEQKASEEGGKKMVEGLLGTVAYIAISSSMLIVNKAAVRALPYPFWVTNLQMIVSVVVIYVMKLAGVVNFPNPDMAKIRKWVGVTVVWAVPILCNMKALQLVNVETVLVFRTMTVLGVALGDKYWLGQQIGALALCGLCSITSGGIVYGMYDVSFNAGGYVWGACYWASMIFNALYMKHVFNKSTDMNTWEKSWLSNAMMLPPLTLYCLVAENLPQALRDMRGMSLGGAALVTLSCFMGLGISVAGTRCREMFSATGFDVLGNMNKFLSIGLSQFLLGSIVTAQSMFGLVIALCGGVIYSPLGKRMCIKIGLVAEEGTRPPNIV